MLYDVAASVVAEMCVRIGVPLSTRDMTYLLGGAVDEYVVEAVCVRMLREGRLVRFTEDTYTTHNMRTQVRLNLLVSDEYQHLGMTLLRVEAALWVRYIPAAAEHRFLEVRPSGIGASAGLGLFVRRTRAIPQGCVLCEYRGRVLKAMPRSAPQGDYVVRVRTAAATAATTAAASGTFIDGVSDAGDNLSLATLINDAGPREANAAMTEYDTLPGRVFVVAHRDLAPGEEVFVLYGAAYWGYASYAELHESMARRRPSSSSSSLSSLSLQKRQQQQQQQQKATPRKRQRHSSVVTHQANTDENGHNGGGGGVAAAVGASVVHGDYAYTCRACGAWLVSRLARLHALHCGDALVQKTLLHLDCMPRSVYTAVDGADRVVPARRARAQRRAMTLVDLSQPQTFSHTHEDVIGDHTFAFRDPSETRSR